MKIGRPQGGPDLLAPIRKERERQDFCRRSLSIRTIVYGQARSFTTANEAEKVKAIEKAEEIQKTHWTPAQRRP